MLLVPWTHLIVLLFLLEVIYDDNLQFYTQLSAVVPSSDLNSTVKSFISPYALKRVNMLLSFLDQINSLSSNFFLWDYLPLIQLLFTDKLFKYILYSVPGIVFILHLLKSQFRPPSHVKNQALHLIFAI